MEKIAGIDTTAEIVAVEPDPTYSGSRRLFVDAAEVFGVHLEEQENEDWRTLLMLAYVIDEMVDVDKDADIKQSLEEVLTGQPFKYGRPQLADRFKSYVGRQTTARQQEVMDQLGQVSDLVRSQALAASAQELIEVQRAEAKLFANILSLPTEGRPDSWQRQRFNDWLQAFSLAGYLADTFIDMNRDFADGSSGLKPSLKTRTQVAAATAQESLTAIRKTPIKLLGKTAVVAFNYEFRGKRLDPSNPAENS